MDVARASDQIDALIVRRATQTAAENEREELWRASVRRHHDKLRTERLRDRLAYHSAMIESHSKNFEELLRRHRVGLRLCEEALGIAAGPGNGRA
ncbi:MAG: hypothetical protein CYG60_17130 [Actinobacteria bacterium]|nr:MAG: hypothetical protein CYG60_17130 [Actinomycetota bacterium]